jgi:hypothetical protein
MLGTWIFCAHRVIIPGSAACPEHAAELEDLMFMQKNGIESIMDSLRRIMVHAESDSSRARDKIAFELLPLMRVLHMYIISITAFILTRH